MDLIADALPGRLCYSDPDAITTAIDYAKFYSRSHDAVIRIYDEAGNVIQTHEHKGDFKDDHATIDRRATPLLDEFPKPRISLV